MKICRFTYVSPPVTVVTTHTLLKLQRSRNDQQYALTCTTPLLYVLAPTCFCSSLGSILDPSELVVLQDQWVVYHTIWRYVTRVPDCRGSVCCASQLSWTSTFTEPRQSGTRVT
jgi:hypothetical protein